MTDPITAQQLIDAGEDARDLADVVNGAADLNGTGLVATRTGGAKKTLSKLQAEFEAVIASQEVQEQQATNEANRSRDEANRSETAATASAASAAASAGVVAAGYYGSAQYADENEEDVGRSLDHCTQLYIANSRSGASAAITSAGNALWNQAGNSLSIYWDAPVEKYWALNRTPAIVSAGLVGPSQNQSFVLAYTAKGTGIAQHRLTFSIRGVTGASADWACFIDYPNSVARKAIHVGQNGTQMRLEVLDLETGTLHVGAWVAKPAGFVGVPSLLRDVAIGAPRNVGAPDAAAFPISYDGGPGVGPQSIRSPRGSFADLIIADVMMTEAQLRAIYIDGADVATTLGAGNVRCHAPLADANGRFTLTVASNIPAVQAAGLTLIGQVRPGPTFRRKTNGGIVLQRLRYPGFSALEYGADVAVTRLSAIITGLTGALGAAKFRLVAASGAATDWIPCDYNLVSAVPTFKLSLPAAMVSNHQVQVCFDRHPTVIGATHSSMQIGAHILPFGQSELAFVTNRLFNTTGLGWTLIDGVDLHIEGDHSTISWVGLGGSLWNSQVRPGHVGYCAVNIGNYIREVTEQPVLFGMHVISGTSLRDLMDDSQIERQWAAEEAAHLFPINRRDNGAVPVTGCIKFGWEAADNVIAYSPSVNWPWYRGVGFPGLTLPFTVNHFLHDGSFSPGMLCLEVGCNRITARPAAGVDADPSNEQDQRASQINYGDLLGYEVGPPYTAHMMQGEVAAGNQIPASPATHPEPGYWEGDLEGTWSFAESACIIMGKRRFPGIIQYEQIRADPSNPNAVILSLGPPRRFPGQGLANRDTGFRRDPEPWTPIASGVRLYTKAVGGNPKWFFEGRRTSADPVGLNQIVSAQFIGNTECRVVFGGPVVPGQTEVYCHRGSPGNYGASVVSQQAWRDGTHWVLGTQGVKGKFPGFQISGSNVPLVLGT